MPSRQRKTHYDTFTKAKFQGIHYFLTKGGIAFDPRDIFQNFGVSERFDYEMIQPGVSSRNFRQSTSEETRERKPKVTETQLNEANHLLNTYELVI